VIEELARIFRKNGWKWKIRGVDPIVPDEDDITAALDAAAEVLTKRNMDQLEMGKLIIRRRDQAIGYEVYVYVGNYE
jgi:hypothetical protein